MNGNPANSTLALVNGRVLGDRGIEEGIAVLVEAGRIVAVVPEHEALQRADDAHDLQGAILLPGFIDCQVNGGGGVLFNNSPDAESLRRIGAAHRRFGTTGFLPSLINDDIGKMREAIAATRAAIAQGVTGVLGIHLEGPYLAPARKGTHDASKFRVPDAQEIGVATALDNGITLITLAPEQVGAEMVRAFVAGGAIVCAGHTAASYEETRAGIDAGISGFTHLFNAMSPLTGREPGAVGSAMEDAGTWCGVIVDGHHVHPASLRVALAAKPRGKVFLVSDAMPPVGADDPSYELYGEVITVRDGVVRNAAGVLAGSALDMATAVRNSVSMLGVSLEEAARMASTYPAEFLGIGDRYGRIAAGYRADLVALDDELQVVATWINGTR